MSDNRYPYRNTGDPLRGQNRTPRRSDGRISAALPRITPGQFPWQLFAAVAFAVVGIVIFSVAVTMLTGGDKKGQNDDAPLYVANATQPSSTVVAFDDPEVSSRDLTNVQKADFTGTWNKTDVYESEKATLTVTDQNELGFSFTLTLWHDKKKASVSGTAYFTSGDSAAYTSGLSAIAFERGTKYMSLYQTGGSADLGLTDGFKPDGKYTSGTPSYYKAEDANGYDYNVYQSDAVVKALSATLSADDYKLYKSMMSRGLRSPIAYERKVDKNGKKVNVDAELDCVKYYAGLSDISTEMILICSPGGKIYVVFYDAAQMRYYTNDEAYSTKMPAAFQAIATANNLTPTYVYK